MSAKKLRNPSLDVVRIFALLLVVSVHFFLHTGYYYTPITGEKLFVMTVIRSFAKACVPMFILLTGYLMRNKTLSGRYYLGVVKTIGIYVLASVFCLLFEKYHLNLDVTFKSAIEDIFDFTGADYAWYVEMYLSLFLAIPFLNAMYKAMDTTKKKLALVGTFLFISSAASIPEVMLPDYMVDVYPFSIYLVGVAIGDLHVKIKRIPNLLLIAAVSVGLGAISFYKCHGKGFSWGVWQADYSLFVVTIAVLIFIFISGFDMTGAPKWLHKTLNVISDNVLGAYLVSFVYDKVFYKELLSRVPALYDRWQYFAVIVPLVFVCSIITSVLLGFVWKMLTAPVALLFAKAKNKATVGVDGTAKK